MDKLIELHKESLIICKTFITEIWSNGWMWENLGRLGNDTIIHHFLIRGDSDFFTYNDTTNTQIEIDIYSSNPNTYRIDIKDRYNIHNFWYFNEDKFKYIKPYVLKIIENQYNSLISKDKIINLSVDAYGFEKEPVLMYETMQQLLREQKLKRILVNDK